GYTVIVRDLPVIDMDELVRLQICDRLVDTWAWVAPGPERLFQNPYRHLSHLLQLPPLLGPCLREWRGVRRRSTDYEIVWRSSARSGDREDPTEVRNSDCSENQIGSIKDRPHKTTGIEKEKGFTGSEGNQGRGIIPFNSEA
ncbi:hypothetical protein Tco_1478868, partial [Tanacetum coccineum]